MDSVRKYLSVVTHVVQGKFVGQVSRLLSVQWDVQFILFINKFQLAILTDHHFASFRNAG